MKFFINKLSAWAIVSMMALVVLISCEDDEIGGTDEVVLLSFGPAGVHHGDEIIFIGSNLDRVTSIVFKPEVEVTEFTTQTSDQIKVNVPDAAEAGTVILRTPGGDIESLSILNFEVPVTITDITAEAKPGTNITITGDKLNWVENVTFSSDLIVEKADFVSQSISELVLQVPMAAQSGFLIFETGGTDPLTFGSEEQLIVTLPAVSGVSPAAVIHTNNLTISGTDLDLVTEVVFFDGLVVSADNFVSQSATEIVVAVPAQTVAGAVVLRQLSPVEVTATEELTIVLPAGSSVSPSPAEPGSDNITITGTALDLVASLEIPGVGVVDASSFISQSPTEIVLAFGDGGSNGIIGYTTVHGFSGSLGVPVTIPGDGPPDLLVTLYDDAISSSYDQGGGWTATTDWASNEQAIEGSLSIKAVYAGGWGGAAQFGQWNGQAAVDISSTEVFTFHIYGGDGAGGQNIQVNFSGGASVQVGIDAGAWKHVEIPLADIGNPTSVSEVSFQDTDWSGTVYIDRVGFSLASGPAALLTTVYDDATSELFDQGGGWTATTEWGSTEFVFHGENSIKATYAGGWGGAAQFGQWNGQTALDVSGASVFTFAIFGDSNAGGNNIQVNLSSGSAQVAITAGEWTEHEIPLSDLGSPSTINEISFQDTDWSGTVYIDYIGFR